MSMGNNRNGVILVDEFCWCEFAPAAEAVECDSTIEKAVRDVGLNLAASTMTSLH